MQGQALVDYVKQVNDLEVAVYTNQRIQSHFDESFALRKPVPPIRPTLKSTAKPTRPTLKEIDNSKSGMCVVIALIILGIVCILFGIWAFSFTFIGGISILPAGIMLTYAGVKVLNKDEETKQNNKDALDAYRVNVEKYDATIQQTIAENEKKQNQYRLALNNYNQEADQYKRKHDEAYALISDSGHMLEKSLDSLYEMGIIYPKYRNLVAVSTIYEYLSSGRCDRLDGPDGAYNLYEMELRQNIVIGQLSSIIENLNQIKNNQFVLYNELVSANQKAASLLADIGNNVKISAYQNEAAAKNAEALKYISLIKH